MPSTNFKTVVLGPEYDERLRSALKASLLALGAKGLGRDWGSAGSQDLEVVEAEIGDQRLVIEAETYVGLSVTGPSELVEKLEAMLAEHKLRGDRVSLR
jgi:hypothetical protein